MSAVMRVVLACRAIMINGLCALCVFGFMIGVGYAHEGAAGIIKERMDKFQQARLHMKQIRGALLADDFVAIAAITQEMRPWAQDMADYFPEGSDDAPSEALPAIWTDSTGFLAKISQYQAGIQQLNAAALSQDKDATRAAFGVVGASCQSCHRTYRQ